MEKIKLKNNEAKIIKIELNEKGDYTAISPDDSMLFDRFVAGYKRIVDLSNDVPAKLEEIEKKYKGQDGFTAVMNKTVEISTVNVQFSSEAVNIIDGIFGANTIRKYFRNCYDEIPDFIPDVECFGDFLEKITPEMEKIFNRKIENQRKRSKERMAKYQPQNHRNPGSK